MNGAGGVLAWLATSRVPPPPVSHSVCGSSSTGRRAVLASCSSALPACASACMQASNSCLRRQHHSSAASLRQQNLQITPAAHASLADMKRCAADSDALSLLAPRPCLAVPSCGVLPPLASATLRGASAASAAAATTGVSTHWCRSPSGLRASSWVPAARARAAIASAEGPICGEDSRAAGQDPSGPFPPRPSPAWSTASPCATASSRCRSISGTRMCRDGDAAAAAAEGPCWSGDAHCAGLGPHDPSPPRLAPAGSKGAVCAAPPARLTSWPCSPVSSGGRSSNSNDAASS